MDFSKVVNINIGGKDVDNIKINSQVVWKRFVDSTDYFYIENLDTAKDTEFSINRIAMPEGENMLSLEKSTDKRNWEVFDPYSYTVIPASKKLYLRGDNSTISPVDNSLTHFQYIVFNQSKLTNVAVGGNINTLLSKDNSVMPSTPISFQNMFWKVFNLKDISNLVLPYTKLNNYIYYRMFDNCNSLENNMKTDGNFEEIAVASFYEMFNECTLLKNEWYLGRMRCSTPANLIGTFQGMYKGCSNLMGEVHVSIDDGVDTSQSSMLCQNMFQNCYNIEVAVTMGIEPINTNLNDMFNGCSKLQEIQYNLYNGYKPAWDEQQALNWVNGVAEQGRFIATGGYSNIPRGVNGVPQNWEYL